MAAGPIELTAKFDTDCSSCGKPIARGARIVFDTGTRQSHHLSCPKFRLPPAPGEPFQPRSARNRRKKARKR